MHVQKDLIYTHNRAVVFCAHSIGMVCVCMCIVECVLGILDDVFQIEFVTIQKADNNYKCKINDSLAIIADKNKSPRMINCVLHNICPPMNDKKNKLL